MEAFKVSLKAYALELGRNMTVPETSLEPPPVFRDSMQQLKELLSSYEMSMVSTDSKDELVNLICSSIIAPLIAACENNSTDLGRLDRSIYKVNCLYSIEIYLSNFTFCEGFIKQIEDYIASAVQDLVTEQVSFTK